MAASKAPLKDEYILTRDFHAMTRLNYQHFLLREQYGYLLHPNIPTDHEDGMTIADVGTGTAIWPIELSRRLPSTASIDAIDISLEQCPPKNWLPSNVHLVAHDVFTPFPEDMVRKYDVVHVQLLICVIKENNPDAVIKNLMSLLKPGGFIQWHEVDINAHRIERPAGSLAIMSASQKMIAFMMKPRESSNFLWAAQLGSHFEKLGLTSVTFERHPITNDQRMFWNLNCLMLCEEYSARLENDNSMEENRGKAAELRRVIGDTSVEFQKGVAIYSELVVAIGQKTL